MSYIMRKPDICLCENIGAVSCAVTAQLISAFVITIPIVHFLFFPNPEFQTSSFFLRLYRLVYVGPGWKPELLVSSWPCSYIKVCFTGLL